MDLKTFADLFLRQRRLILIGLVVATSAAAWGLAHIGFDDNPRDVFRSDDDDFQLMEEVFDQFGADENTCYLVVTSPDLFSRESLEQLKRLVARVDAMDQVESVVSLLDRRLLVMSGLPHPVIPDLEQATDEQLEVARRAALNHPLIKGHLLSDDARHTLVTLRIRGNEMTVSELQPTVTELWSLAGDTAWPAGFEVQVTGVPAIRVDGFASVRSESVRYTLLGAAAAISMAILLMRRVATIVAVCSAAMMGAFWSVGALGLIGEKITVLTTVLPMLAMIVGFTDAVHLASDISHARLQNLSPRLATHGALRHLTIACLLTSITTAIGFGSLCVSQTSIIRRFGVACSLGAILTFFAVITVLPLLASTRLGKFMLPPARTAGLEQRFQRLAEIAIEFTLRHRWLITVLGIALAICLVPFVTHLSPENEIAENLPSDARSIKALRVVDAGFGGILPLFVCVDWPEHVQLDSAELQAALQAVHDVCGDQPVIAPPLSLLTIQQAAGGLPLALLPDSAITAMARPAQRRTVVMARAPDLGSRRLGMAFEETSGKLRELEQQFPGFRFRLTGSAVLATRNLGQMISDLASSLSLATAVIFLTITLACRSLRLGLICLIPNAIPLLLTAAVLALVDGSLRFAGVIVFSVCLGIAVDDTIHLIMRFRRELQATRDVDQAIRNSVRAVGSALIITTLVLLVGLAIPLSSDVPGNRMFAGLSCTAIAAALVADLLLLPAMLACFVRVESHD